MNGSILIQTTGGSDTDLTFLWSNGAVTKDLNNIGAGIYSLTVTSVITGDTLIVSGINITEPEELIANVEVTPSTGQNGTAVFNVFGGVKPYVFKLDPEVPDITKLAPGFYTLTVTDANMCTKIVNFVIEMSSSTSDLVKIAKIYPNPAKDFIQIDISGSFQTMSLIEPNGRLVRAFSEAEISEKVLNIQSVVPGLYYLFARGTKGEIYLSTVGVVK